MANNYTMVVGDHTIPASEEDVKHLAGLLETLGDEDDPHGMQVEWFSGEAHMFSDDYGGGLTDVPEVALEFIAEMLKKAELKFWTFGVCWYCAKQRPGEFGGSKIRICDDGSLEHQDHFWPSEESLIPRETTHLDPNKWDWDYELEEPTSPGNTYDSAAAACRARLESLQDDQAVTIGLYRDAKVGLKEIMETAVKVSEKLITLSND